MQFELRKCTMTLLYVLALLIKISWSEVAIDQNEQEKAEVFLKYYNSSIVHWYYKKFTALWNEETNITAYNQEVNVNTSLAFASFQDEIRRNASKFNISQLKKDTARQIKLIISSTELKNKTEQERKETLKSSMKAIYNTAKVIFFAVRTSLLS